MSSRPPLHAAPRVLAAACLLCAGLWGASAVTAIAAAMTTAVPQAGTIAATLAATSLAATPAATSPAQTATGSAPGPDFPFTDLKGVKHTLAEYRGQVVLLEFWASWCVPCRKGFPFLDGLQARHEPAGFKVVAVTLEEDDESVRKFAEDHPGRFVVGRDPSGSAGELYEVAAMPTSILLDAQGRILARFEGGTESVHKEIEQAVRAALRGDPIVVASAARKKGPTGNLRAWERGYLADPIMNLDGDTLTRSMREHVHASKEGAAGDGGVAGGGCGCN